MIFACLQRRSGNNSIPSDPEVIAHLVKLLEERRYEEAREALNAHDFGLESKATVLCISMSIERETGNLSAEVELGKRLFAEAPIDFNILIRIIFVCIFLGRGEDASALLEKAKKLDPTNIVIDRLEHDNARTSREPRTALEISSKLADRDDATPDDVMRLVGDYLFLGEFERADEILTALQQKHPDIERIYKWAFHLAAVSGLRQKGEKWARLARAHNLSNDIRRDAIFYEAPLRSEPVERVATHEVDASVRERVSSMRFDQLVEEFVTPGHEVSLQVEEFRRGILSELWFRIRTFNTPHDHVQNSIMLPIRIQHVLWGLKDQATLDSYRNALLPCFRPLWRNDGAERSFHEMISYILCLHVLDEPECGRYEEYIADNFANLAPQHAYIFGSRINNFYRLAWHGKQTRGDNDDCSKLRQMLDWVFASKHYPGAMEIHYPDAPPVPKRFDDRGGGCAPLLGIARRNGVKAAICVSGQLRNYRAAAEQWRKCKFLQPQFDVFVSTWRATGARAFFPQQAFRHFEPGLADRVTEYVTLNGLPQFLKNIPQTLHSKIGLVENLSAVTFEDLDRTYRPRAVRIEEEPVSAEGGVIHHNSEKMLYKIEDCFRLAAAEGLEKYDLVVRVRPDKSVWGLPENWAEQALEIIGDNHVILTERPALHEPSLHPTTGLVIGDMSAIGRPEDMAVYSTAYSFFHTMRPNERAMYPTPLGGHWPLTHRLMGAGILAVGMNWSMDNTISFPLVGRDEFYDATRETADVAFLRFFFDAIAP